MYSGPSFSWKFSRMRDPERRSPGQMNGWLMSRERERSIEAAADYLEAVADTRSNIYNKVCLEAAVDVMCVSNVIARFVVKDAPEMEVAAVRFSNHTLALTAKLYRGPVAGSEWPQEITDWIARCDSYGLRIDPYPIDVLPAIEREYYRPNAGGKWTFVPTAIDGCVVVEYPVWRDDPAHWIQGLPEVAGG